MQLGFYSVSIVWAIVALFSIVHEVSSRQRTSRCGYPPEGKKSVTMVSDDGAKVDYKCMPHYTNTTGNTTLFCGSSNTWIGEPLICEDAENCIDENKPCENGGRCQESDPSFECRCRPGYLGGLCDEANGNWGSWQSWSNCTSTCSKGIQIRVRACDNPKPTKKGLMCQGDMMEVKNCTQDDCLPRMYKWCEYESERCGAESDRAFCSMREGSFRCTCLQGVAEIRDKNGTFIRCEDIDECTSGTHSCQTDTTDCVNTFGSYNCTCKNGYEKYKGSCRDIDECASNLHNCDVNARCLNNPGGYSCTCHTGFRSLSANETGFQGDCRILRVLLYGSKQKDIEATATSRVSGERLTPVIHFPTGIPIQDEAGSLQTCRSIYATENGIVLITNLTESSAVSLLETYRHPVLIKKNTEPFSITPHVCAWIAPFWSDATLDDKSKLWYHLYDMEELIKSEKRRRKAYKLSTEIRKLLPDDFIPKHVAVVTWDKTHPPWPSIEEGMTFQTILATDGVRSYVTNIYEDQAMTWRPVYDVPNDIPRYQAVAGFYINGKSPKAWLHLSSGNWTEPLEDVKGKNVYRLDKATFSSTGVMGIDTHPLTPTLQYRTSPKYLCSEWHRETLPITDDIITKTSSCPPYQSDVTQEVNATWISNRNDRTTACYTWMYKFWSGGTYECCYNTKAPRMPLVSGINALAKGAGFYYKNKTDGLRMREMCCNETGSNYFCNLYVQRRPPTSFNLFKSPVKVSVHDGLNLTSAVGKHWVVSGSGEARLLRVDRLGRPRPVLEMIGRYEEKNGKTFLSAFGLQADNFTIEIYRSDLTAIDCLFNLQPCADVRSPNVTILSSPTLIKLSSRSGVFFNISLSEQGGLEFNGILPTNILYDSRHVTSGLLSDTSKCFGKRLSSRSSPPFIACDLQSLAQSKHVDAQELSFFSRAPGGFYELPMTANRKDRNSSTNKTNIGSMPSVERQARAVAEVKSNGQYQVAVDLPGVFGNITVTNYDGDVHRSVNEIIFQVNSSFLEKLQIVITENNGATSLIFPDVVICDCGKNGECDLQITTDIPGPFATRAPCVCNTGYTGEKCENKVDLCSWNPCFFGVSCTDHSTFERRGIASYECGKCPAELEAGNGESCYHDNPCLRDPGTPGAHECENATCIHQPIGYKCVCLKGFRESQDPRICHDIDECEDSKTCHSDGEICINTLGSHECVHPHSSDETQPMEDVDECLVNNGGCERRCKNTQGSFYCDCEVGYKIQQDDKSCIAIDECQAYGNKHCTQICVDYPREKPFRCECLPQFKLAEDYTTCIPLFSTVPSTVPATTTIHATTTVETTAILATTEWQTTADQTTSRMVTSAIAETTIQATTDSSPTTTVSLYDSLSLKDRHLWNILANIPGFSALSKEEKLRVLELIKALKKLLQDPFLRKLLLRVFAHDGLSAKCEELQIYMTENILNLEKIKTLLRGLAKLSKKYLNPKILSLQLNLYDLLEKNIQTTGSIVLSFKEMLGHSTLPKRCSELWRLAATTPITKQEPKVGRRDTTLQHVTDSTFIVRTSSLSLPWLLAWIAIATTAIVLVVFVMIIVGTKLCFKWSKKSEIQRQAIARRKKIEKMQQWPKVVMPTYSY